MSKDLQNTFRHHKIKTPLTSISLNKLKDLAADRVVWRGEIARCKERKFLISQSGNTFFGAGMWGRFSIFKMFGRGVGRILCFFKLGIRTVRYLVNIKQMHTTH